MPASMRLHTFVLLCALPIACAQVPRESVELSATVGRDIAAVHDSHRQTAQLLFGRMRRDINRFVDDVYAPHQIRAVFDRQRELATSSDPELRKISLFRAIEASLKPDASERLQAAVLKGFASTVAKVREDIESMRKRLLENVDAQEREVLDAIDRSYQQIHYANSIVTGHLSSVAKVHEAQEEILNAIGVEDLRGRAGTALAGISDNVARIVDNAERVSGSLEDAERVGRELIDAVRGIGDMDGNGEE